MIESIERRDVEFMRSVARAMRYPQNRRKSIRAIVEEVAAGPAPGYFVSFSRADQALTRSVTIRLTGRKTRAMREAMWSEIAAKTRGLMERRGLRRVDALTMVLAGGVASSYFISGERAWRIYEKNRKKMILKKRDEWRQ